MLRHFTFQYSNSFLRILKKNIENIKNTKMLQLAIVVNSFNQFTNN